MPRRVQDIVPGDKRSIRNIPAGQEEAQSEKSAKEKPSSRPNKKRIDDESPVPIHRITDKNSEAFKRMPITPPALPARRKSKRSGSKILLLVAGVVVVIAGIAFIASTHFSRATFTIVPKSLPVNVNSTYIAQSTPAAGVLTYQLLTLRESASTTVPATDGAYTSTKSQGKVTIYNSYSAQPQRLIAGTRLSAASGLIYRLNSSVLIPGYSSSKGITLPGTVTATIVADQSGQNYDISGGDTVSDFKVVAYSGTPKYADIYARVASGITGGFTGTKKTIAPAALASSTANLQSQITTTLASEAKSAVPEGYIMYDSGHVTSFSEPMLGGTDPHSAIVSIQGTFYGILFKKSELTAKVAGDQSVAAFGSFAYATPGLDSLVFSITNLKDFSPESKNALIIHLKGNMSLVGIIPVDELKKKLAGVSLADTQNILKAYNPIIESGSGELIPPWSKVPSDPARITINVADK